MTRIRGHVQKQASHRTRSPGDLRFRSDVASDSGAMSSRSLRKCSPQAPGSPSERPLVLHGDDPSEVGRHQLRHRERYARQRPPSNTRLPRCSQRLARHASALSKLTCRPHTVSLTQPTAYGRNMLDNRSDRTMLLPTPGHDGRCLYLSMLYRTSRTQTSCSQSRIFSPLSDVCGLSPDLRLNVY